jgi:hypothetical protein
MNKKEKINIAYIGLNEDFIKAVVLYFDVHYREYVGIKYKMFKPNDFNQDDIFKFNPNVLMYDILTDEDFSIRDLLSKIETYLFPNKMPVFGLFSHLNECVATNIKICKPSFTFRSTLVGEEVSFLSKTLMSVIAPQCPIKKNFAVARPNSTAYLNLSVFLKELSLEKLNIETNFNLNVNRMEINNSMIKKIINFNHKDIIYQGTNTEVTQLNNEFSQHFKYKIITPREKKNIMADVNDYINRNKIKGIKAEQLMLKMIQDKKDEILNERVFKFNKWFNNNKDLHKRKYKKSVAIVISKNFHDLKINFSLQDKLEVLVFEKLSPELILKIKKLKPRYLIWDFELPEVLEEEAPYPLFKDIVFEKNHLLSLQKINNELGYDFFNRETDLIIFSGDSQFNKDFFKKNIQGLFKLSCPDIKYNPLFVSTLFLAKHKNDQSLLKPVKVDLDKQTIEFDPTDKHADLSVGIPIFINLLTEAEIIIKSPTELPMLTPIKLKNKDFSMMLTLVNNDKINKSNKNSKEKVYHGYINGMTESERQLIRSYVITHDSQSKKAS